MIGVYSFEALLTTKTAARKSKVKSQKAYEVGFSSILFYQCVSPNTVALEGISPCGNEIVADYLINLDLPDEGTICTL